MKERFPRLIHCRISGFGADGPMGGLPGYDAVIQAMVGMFSINGMPPDAQANGGPTRIGIPLVDIGTGLYAAIAVLMALVERARSGRGPVHRHDTLRRRHRADAPARRRTTCSRAGYPG